jgi:RNA polymerase sigma factor (sigma-70 family)
MEPIYNKDTIDFSDEGEQAKNVESKVEVELLIKRFTPRQREILYMKLDGYTHEEIAKKLGISKKTVDREMSLVRKQCGII